MTKDEILQMAREAGFVLASNATGEAMGRFSRFADRVAAAEREACAEECDKTYHQHIGDGFGEVRYGIAACAAAIRARSTK